MVGCPRRLRGVMRKSPVVAFIKDETGGYVYANQRKESISQVGLSDLQDITVFDLSSEPAGQVIERERKVLSVGPVTDLTETISTPEGNRHWMVLKFPFTKSDGQSCLAGVAVDITERIEMEELASQRFSELLQAEEKLRDSEQRYRNLVESSLGLICTHDLNGYLLSINPAAAVSLGYQTGEMIGKDLRQFLVPAVRRHFDGYLERVYQNGSDSGLILLLTKGGQQRAWKYHNTMCSESEKLQYVLGHAQDVTDLKQAQEEAKALSLTDELTGLYNQRGFFTLAEQHMKLARRTPRNKKGLLLVYADMDGLKQINDRFGHKEGSLALVKTADILRQAFRDSDIIGRLGGDEFAVLAIEAPEHSGELMSARLQKLFKEYNAQNNHPFELSLSVGTAVIDGDSEVSVQEVLTKADQSMYRDKLKKQTSAEFHLREAARSNL